jgi:DNA-binding transcriptional ArsR family regulator
MKLFAIVLAIGFCFLAGLPLFTAPTHGERTGTCCMTNTQGNTRMSCQMSTGMQACTCKTHTQAGSASYPSCGGACSPVSAIPVQSTGLLDRIRRYTAHGYRRVTGKNILEHGTRYEIYELIVALPGIDLRTLIRLTGVNENTLRYHLDRIQTGGKIKVTTVGGISHYFENHGKYSEDEQILKARMFTSGSSRILHLVEDNPGLTRGELAEYLGIAGPSVTRSVSHLIEDGLIRLERDGRFSRYYPAWTNAPGLSNPIFT